ncbi:L-ascorbate metabolism protein UlaG, beta-lactamase superfamily [Planococcus glaciei]|nr:L-ascorbate metabolism protein UlaG, beta-lactamase superfamily [Planococcus glaciei]
MSDFEEHPPKKKNRKDAPTRKKILKKIMRYLFIIVSILVMAVLLVINLSPTFGGNPSKEQKEAYEVFDNYKDGKFVNLPSEIPAGSIEVPATLATSMSSREETSPSVRLPVSEIDWNAINSDEDSLTWLGHSAFILSIDKKKILVDPMLGPIASPVSFIGPKRYSEDLLGIVEKLPPIDAVFITHDHYDHLDYQSITKLESKVAHFFVPYGVSSHLIDWGIAKEKITELNWWEEAEFQELTVALTPAKHFSGRGILNQNLTLWGGWVILGEQTRFYVSGDGGYDAHFKEIGDTYGPFDIALIEGGQYDTRWPESHMQPEESVQASIDVQGKEMVLTHWGAFTLARHGWTEPIERAAAAAEERGVTLTSSPMGETVPLDGSLSSPFSTWWKSATVK